MATVNIPDELYAEIEQRMKETNSQGSVDQIVESVLYNFLGELDEAKTYYHPDPEELADLQEAVKETEQEEANGSLKSLEQVRQELKAQISQSYEYRKVSA